eukprot:6808060-Alexandrium_andersonii.AAC.1
MAAVADLRACLRRAQVAGPVPEGDRHPQLWANSHWAMRNDGDNYALSELALRARGPCSLALKWAPAHKTREHGAQGAISDRDLMGNDLADSTATCALLSKSRTFIHLFRVVYARRRQLETLMRCTHRMFIDILREDCVA